MKKLGLLKALIIGSMLAALFIVINTSAVSAKPLDEIVDYSVTIDVNEDATLNMIYDISWKVLDSDSEGPLEWVKIGVPNSHSSNLIAITDNIHSLSTMSSGGSYIRVDFDRKYYEDEIIHFTFCITQDYMYQYYPEENICEYTFIPGWFDDIAIDNMTIKWNCVNVDRFTPAATVEDGYYTWNGALEAGEKMPSVTMTYLPDAYGFDLTKHLEEDSDENTLKDVIITIIAIVLLFGMLAIMLGIPILIVYFIYRATSGFIASQKVNISRTIIEYYPSCPNCGGTRAEGKDTCSYCDTNMIKSKQVVKEEDIKEEDKGALKYKKNGDFVYSDNPYRYVRVHVTPAPVVRPTSHSSSHHSSCAHSSCACACACACAGGGRAGCSMKDFYNTNLKLSYLRKR